jgi:formamidopyrimidine-DNA glycosylase
MPDTVELGGPLIDRPTVTLLTEEVNRLDRRAKALAAELNARADLFIALYARLEGVAKVCDNNGHEVIAEAIRDAMSKAGHPDDV